jgi:hypothetical protein
LRKSRPLHHQQQQRSRRSRRLTLPMDTATTNTRLAPRHRQQKEQPRPRWTLRHTLQLGPHITRQNGYSSSRKGEQPMRRAPQRTRLSSIITSNNNKGLGVGVIPGSCGSLLPLSPDIAISSIRERADMRASTSTSSLFLHSFSILESSSSTAIRLQSITPRPAAFFSSPLLARLARLSLPPRSLWKW